METARLTKGAKTVWTVVEKLIFGFVIFIATWMFTTVNGLENRVTEIESGRKENEAQWIILKQHGKTMQEQEIQIEVYKRLFEMLLDKNRITVDSILVPRDNEPLEVFRRDPPEKTTEEFRHEQMQMNEQEVQENLSRRKALK
jgi:hypothetical protein